MAIGLAVGILYFYLEKQVLIADSMLLGVVFAICLTIAQWLENAYKTSTDIEGVTYVGNIGLFGFIAVVVAVGVLAQGIEFLRTCRLRT